MQNAVLILILRYARTQPGDMYLATSAVVVCEVLKLAACLAILLVQQRGVRPWLRLLHTHVVADPVDTVKVAVPSFIYTLQNNLLYVAISNLDAATYQVSYQLKILTTALCSVFMLKRSLSGVQWLALVILFIGVSIVQLEQQGATTTGVNQRPLVGLLAVVAACATSGFAGVYFEKILKGSDVSIWVRNVQLCVFSIPIGVVVMLMTDGAEVRARGPLHGFGVVVWVSVAIQAFGGLLVAVVVKYADNILKGFATTVSIVISCVASVYLFDFVVTATFAVGAVLVVASIFLYNRTPGAAAAVPKLEMSPVPGSTSGGSPAKM
ncbi:PREDICTED: UDP-galactose translocator-like isoform X2 [Priapulus caudatus]|nr:PREDICTED: UDP-galactose translocator-like isoform X2 [Priapulus caudatus]